MTDAQLHPPGPRDVLRSFAGHLDADPAIVFARLETALAAGDEVAGHVAVDRARSVVVVEGDWWYRGEYRVLPEETGALVQFEIINAARLAHWAAGWAARSVLAAAPAAFGRLLTGVQSAIDLDLHGEG